MLPWPAINPMYDDQDAGDEDENEVARSLRPSFTMTPDQMIEWRAHLDLRQRWTQYVRSMSTGWLDVTIDVVWSIDGLPFLELLWKHAEMRDRDGEATRTGLRSCSAIDRIEPYTRSAANWIRHRILELLAHEADEVFKIDGVRLFDPHTKEPSR